MGDSDKKSSLIEENYFDDVWILHSYGECGGYDECPYCYGLLDDEE